MNDDYYSNLTILRVRGEEIEKRRYLENKPYEKSDEREEQIEDNSLESRMQI